MVKTYRQPGSAFDVVGKKEEVEVLYGISKIERIS
jgi:hypothetical protein